MFDVGGGRETIESDLGLDSSSEEVAVWIEAQASKWRSPSVEG